MRLPESLLLAIEEECSSCSTSDLKKAQERLSKAYHERRNSSFPFHEKEARLAYLATRMPATYAAVFFALQGVKKVLVQEPTSFLDLGAGPLTASFAAAECFSELQSIVCVEQNSFMLELGKKLAKSHPAFSKASFLLQSLDSVFPSASLVMLSYVIAELTPSKTKELLERIWQNKAEVVVIVEPGTPEGFQRIIRAREFAISKGAYLLAPCPSVHPCPMKAPHWCHFPARVERSRLHRQLKGGTLGYEDEKFSYIAFGREVPRPVEARVVGLVEKGSGYVRAPLCTQGELKEVAISRKNTFYSQARDLCWGDSLVTNKNDSSL